jgi:hypothetical protein
VKIKMNLAGYRTASDSYVPSAKLPEQHPVSPCSPGVVYRGTEGARKGRGYYIGRADSMRVASKWWQEVAAIEMIVE